jgi:hypothetical protein
MELSDYDDSLEVGVAAGLDPATALAISERNNDDEPQPPFQKGCGCAAFAMALGMVLAGLGWLLR